MSEFEDPPVASEVVRLIKTGWFDRTVNRLQRQHPGIDVADAVGTAVLKLVTRSLMKEPIDDVAGYLYQTAVHGVYDAHEKLQRHPDVEYGTDELDTSLGPDQDHELLKKEAYRALQRLVRGWPNRNMREYILLWIDACYFQEPLTLADAARKLTDILGEPVNVGSVGQWKRRGLAKLIEDYQSQRQADDGQEQEPDR